MSTAPTGNPLETLLGFLVEAEEWLAEAICKIEHAPSKYFVLEQGYTASKARQYCARCPVRQQCLDYGIKTGSVGVWGGEVLGLSHREEIELTPLVMVQNAKPLSYLIDPPPLQAHQIPTALFG